MSGGDRNGIPQRAIRALLVPSSDQRLRYRPDCGWIASSPPASPDVRRFGDQVGCGNMVVHLRDHRGGVMLVIVACIMLLAILVGAFVYYTLTFGGSQEVRNAVDAGTLNVGQQITEVKVKAENDEERQFEDVADSQNKFGLTNINRVWAKALLVRLNADAIADGAGSGAASHADALRRGAQSLSDKLIKKLKDNEGRYFFFNLITMQNDPKMLGKKAQIDAEKGGFWKESYCDRKAESNITVRPEQFPGTDGAVIAKAPDGVFHLPGYTPLLKDFSTDNYYCVPYKVGESTHLTSRGFFDLNSLLKNTDTAGGWANPVPNAFSSEGKCVEGKSTGMKAVACVQVNPQRTFKLAIPHSFVRVKLNKNRIKFRVNGISHPETDGEYGTVPSTLSHSFPDGFGVGIVTAYATVGLEYLPPNLWKAIYALPGDHDEVTKVLLQRCREFAPDASEGDLKSALMNCALVPGEDEYFIFSVGDDKTGNVKVTVAPASVARSSASWLDLKAEPDSSSENKIASEFVGPVPAPVPAPNVVLVSVAGAGVVVYLPSFVTESATEKWKPGSGYGQCLGELTIDRDTTVDANGVVEPIP